VNRNRSSGIYDQAAECRGDLKGNHGNSLRVPWRFRSSHDHLHGKRLQFSSNCEQGRWETPLFSPKCIKIDFPKPLFNNVVNGEAMVP
jgi:hypothetical protein